MTELTNEHGPAPHDSWLSLVLLCMVAAMSAALGFSGLFAGASVAYAVVESSIVGSSTPLTSGVSSSEAAQPDSSSNQVAADSVTQASDDSMEPAPAAKDSNETSGRIFTRG